jgi:hypothetical protein
MVSLRLGSSTFVTPSARARGVARADLNLGAAAQITL